MRRVSLLAVFLFVLCIPFLSTLFISSSSMASDKLPDNYGATQASQASSVEISNVPEKQPRWSWPSPSGAVNLVAISQVEQYICVGTSYGYVYLFDTNGVIPLDNEFVGASIGAICISDSGDYLAASGGNLGKVYRIEAGQLQYLWNFSSYFGDLQYLEGGIYSLAFSFDGGLLAVGTWAKSRYTSPGTYAYSHVYLFNTTTGTRVEWDINNVYYGDDYVSVDISGNGECIIAGSTYSSKVYLFNKESPSPVHTPFLTDGPVKSVAISEEHYAVGSDKIYYFSINDSGALWSQEIDGSISSVSISENEQYTSGTTETQFSFFTNDSSKIGEWTFATSDTSSKTSISADGTYCTAKSSNYCYFFSMSSDADPSTYVYDPLWLSERADNIYSISISSEGRYVVIGSGANLYLYDSTYDPDLVPTQLQFSKSSALDGEKVTIHALINNTGNVDSESTLVRFYDDTLLIGTIVVGPILQQSHAWVAVSSYMSPPREHEINVVVDFNDILYESNEANNMLMQKFPVNPYAFADTGANPVVAEVGHAIKAVSLSSNGYYFIAGTEDNYAYLFFRNHSLPVWSFSAEDTINTVCISEDGSYVAVAAGNVLSVFSRANDVPLWNFSSYFGDLQYLEGGIYSLAFSFDGGLLAVGTWAKSRYTSPGTYAYSHVYLFNTTTGTRVEWDINNVYYGDDYVSVDISGNGEYIVAGSTYSSKVYLFNKESPSPVHTPFLTDGPVKSVAISEDDFYVAGASSLYYFSKESPGSQWFMPFHSAITSVSICDDGTYMTVTNQTQFCLVKNNQTRLWSYDLTESCAAISADGNHIAVKSSHYAYLFSKARNTPLWMYPTESLHASIASSSEGRYSAYSGEDGAIFFDLYHKADLVPSNITFSNLHPNEGDIIEVQTTISNIGQFKSYYVPIQLFDNDTLVGGVEVAPLSPGISAIVSINYTCQPNHRMLKVYANSWLTQTYESDYTNNAIITSLYVNARPEKVTLEIPTNPTSNSLDLSWSRNTDSDFARYEVWRSCLPFVWWKWESVEAPWEAPPGIYWKLVETITDQSTTSYTVTDLDASTVYVFFVRVFDTRNAFSDSNQVNATTLPTSVTLSSPTNPKSTCLDLNWTANTDNEFDRYEIYTSTSEGELGVLLATITNQSETNCTVTGLQGSNVYYFTIRVVNPQGLSSYSNQVRGVTSPTPVHLNNPADRTLSSLKLTWTQNGDVNFQKYEIYRSTRSEALGVPVAGLNDQSITTYTVAGLNHSTRYYFVVQVVGLEGLSTPSNQVWETTLGPGWDFTISVTPSSQNVTSGDLASYVIQLTMFGEQSSGKSIALSVSGIPKGATYDCVPSSVTSNRSSTLTVFTVSFTEEGTYTLTITATGDQLTKNKAATLIVLKEPFDPKWLYVALGLAITSIVAVAVVVLKKRRTSTDITSNNAGAN